jgi:hypothetical protein
MLYQTLPAIYETFAKYSKPKDFLICLCCLSEDEKRVLLSRKLVELSADELKTYSANVLLTVGSAPDFKYFLPRILDHSVNERFSWPDPQVVFGKLGLAEWTDWPGSEQQAVIDLLNEKFTRLLEDENTLGAEIDRWVCAVGHCLPDVTPYLGPLLAEANEDKLLSFIEWNWTAMSEGKLASAFWEHAPENQQRVLDWLNQEPVKRLLSEKYGMVF